MDEDVIREFYEIINMFETTLYALKWQYHQNEYQIGYDAIISEYDFVLRRLKVCCINNIGYFED